jgi:hypothetical protein
LTSGLHRLWPGLADVAIDHAWCGVLGVARDWCPSVGLDHSTGLAWAGGYVGDGVTTSHLAGRTLAELIAGEDTPRTRLPWVDHRSRRWEPEPVPSSRGGPPSPTGSPGGPEAGAAGGETPPAGGGHTLTWCALC